VQAHNLDRFSVFAQMTAEFPYTLQCYRPFPSSKLPLPLGDLVPHRVVSCNWMSAASVAVVATSGERHEGKAGMVLFAGKTV